MGVRDTVWRLTISQPWTLFGDAPHLGDLVFANRQHLASATFKDEEPTATTVVIGDDFLFFGDGRGRGSSPGAKKRTRRGALYVILNFAPIRRP
jgi:hypothetical protein